MIELLYKWNEDKYCFELFSLLNGETKYLESFSDREDLLIYIEKQYKLATLYVGVK